MAATRGERGGVRVSVTCARKQRRQAANEPRDEASGSKQQKRPPLPFGGGRNAEKKTTNARLDSPVVDDDVREHLDPRVVQRRDAVAQLGLGAVARVEVVQVARQVALRAHGVRGGGQPDAGEAGLCVCCRLRFVFVVVFCLFVLVFWFGFDWVGRVLLVCRGVECQFGASGAGGVSGQQTRGRQAGERRRKPTSARAPFFLQSSNSHLTAAHSSARDATSRYQFFPRCDSQLNPCSSSSKPLPAAGPVPGGGGAGASSCRRSCS